MPGINQFNPGGDPFAALLTTSPSGTSFALSVTLPYVPDPVTSALVITEGAIVAGPFPAIAVLNPDGSYSLRLSLAAAPAGLVDGPIVLTPGDLAGSTFTPRLDPVTGQPVQLTGVLASQTSTGATLDWDVDLGPALRDIESGNPAGRLEAQADEYLHWRWSVRDAATGQPLFLTGSADLVKVEHALTRQEPQESDWQTAGLIIREAGDETDGEYGVLKIGPAAALALAGGLYYSYGRLTTTAETIVRHAPGITIVQG